MDSLSGYKVLDHTQRGSLAVAFFGFSVGFSGFFVFLGLVGCWWGLWWFRGDCMIGFVLKYV